MPIAILPARLANQIAAGEVVERPASVVKELVENSLDAGATRIQIDIEKGGAKRIRIVDNGVGIAKDELTLALSRHATSKIQNLDDLEAISSLGFRGEALASISSVARLTLISKPQAQDNAWQAYAEGRDMAVTVQPAAHPDGTTIDVCDLFFNTPARRKFLRTEKTEFAHIEEVIKRIALAKFNVTFILTHNQKTIKTYRAIKSDDQKIKRIAAVCGQSFVDHAIEVNCQHDDIHLTGWIAKPNFTRKQNDLCYSYVNGRMMRDKLINHAIRQAYGEFIDTDVYSAFVLYLSLDYKEVDVNVHPAKHEVRFHQGRYVHDFIYSVCHKALVEQGDFLPPEVDNYIYQQPVNTEQAVNDTHSNYIRPLTFDSEPNYQEKSASDRQSISSSSYQPYSMKVRPHVSEKTIIQAAENYQQLMSTPALSQAPETSNEDRDWQLLTIYQEKFALYLANDQIKLCTIEPLALALQQQKIAQLWPQGLVSQPLLLPLRLKLTVEQQQAITNNQRLLEASGIFIQLEKSYGKIRQFPALLRDKDVVSTTEKLLEQLILLTNQQAIELAQWQYALALTSLPEQMSFVQLQTLWQSIINDENIDYKQLLTLNSVPVDLTSTIHQLMPANHD